MLRGGYKAIGTIHDNAFDLASPLPVLVEEFN